MLPSRPAVAASGRGRAAAILFARTSGRRGRHGQTIGFAPAALRQSFIWQPLIKGRNKNWNHKRTVVNTNHSFGLGRSNGWRFHSLRRLTRAPLPLGDHRVKQRTVNGQYRRRPNSRYCWITRRAVTFLPMLRSVRGKSKAHPQHYRLWHQGITAVQLATSPPPSCANLPRRPALRASLSVLCHLASSLCRRFDRFGLPSGSTPAITIILLAIRLARGWVLPVITRRSRFMGGAERRHAITYAMDRVWAAASYQQHRRCAVPEPEIPQSSLCIPLALVI